jgi:toxin HigB-1
MAIVSFKDKLTENFYLTGKVPTKAKWQNIAKIALRKLDMLCYASDIMDLLSPPNNRLELLKGNLAGYYSVRINSQWRIIFRWTIRGPSNVSIVDYHS